jgi:hypothetical protein
MTLRLPMSAILLLLAAAMTGFGAQAQPSDARDALKVSLLERWEGAQRDDPQTLRFEGLGEGRYRFHTERFPFDGELQVVNLSVDTLDGWITDDYRVGVVEIELKNLPEGFMQRHAYSVAQWRSRNQFYFAVSSGRWLTPAEWQRALSEPVPLEDVPQSTLGCIVDWVYVLLIVIFVLAVALLMRKASGQFRRATSTQDEALAGQRRALEISEQALENARETRRLLTEIRDLLREQRSG